jgi:hypothetical protein
LTIIKQKQVTQIIYVGLENVKDLQLEKVNPPLLETSQETTFSRLFFTNRTTGKISSLDLRMDTEKNVVV